MLRIRDHIELVKGENIWDFNVPFGKVKIKNTQSNTKSGFKLLYRWKGNDDKDCIGSIKEKVEEQILTVPTGTGSIIRIPKRLSASEEDIEEIVQVKVKAGEVVEVEI